MSSERTEQRNDNGNGILPVQHQTKGSDVHTLCRSCVLFIVGWHWS